MRLDALVAGWKSKDDAEVAKRRRDASHGYALSRRVLNPGLQAAQEAAARAEKARLNALSWLVVGAKKPQPPAPKDDASPDADVEYHRLLRRMQAVADAASEEPGVLQKLQGAFQAAGGHPGLPGDAPMPALLRRAKTPGAAEASRRRKLERGWASSTVPHRCASFAWTRRPAPLPPACGVSAACLL